MSPIAALLVNAEIQTLLVGRDITGVSPFA